MRCCWFFNFVQVFYFYFQIQLGAETHVDLTAADHMIDRYFIVNVPWPLGTGVDHIGLSIETTRFEREKRKKIVFFTLFLSVHPIGIQSAFQQTPRLAKQHDV